MIANRPQTDINEIKRVCSILYRPGEVGELRAFDNKGFSHPGYYDDFNKLAEDAARLSNRPDITAVYVTLNVIKPALLARTANHLYPDSKDKKTTADVDVLTRRWFFIDVDANTDGVKGISSTDAEHQATVETARNIMQFLTSIGFPKDSMILADSGNGTHILVRIGDLPNNDENTLLIKTGLATLKARFTGIDEAIYNAARICKLAGTVCRKGDVIEGRPHRTAKLLEVPENIVIASSDALKALAALAPEPEKPATQKTTYQSRGNAALFDVEKWLADHGLNIAKIETNNGITKYILKVCAFNPEHNNNACAAILKLPNGALDYKCQHEGCVNNDWKKLRAMLEPEYANRQNGQRNEQRTTLTETADPRILNDTTNAQEIVRLFGGVLRYDHKCGRWLIWNGNRYQPDHDGQMYRLAIKATRARYQAAADISDLKERERISNWAITSENRGRLEAAIAIAQNLEPIADTGENWDNDPWLLGVQNGVIDLRTGQFRQGRQSDNITMSAGCNYDANAKCPVWLKTVSDIFINDQEMIDWIHRLCGYASTGSIKEQQVGIGHGLGANGKGVFARGLRSTLGDYAYDAPFATFEMNSFRSSIPNDIAALEHKRFVTSSETNDGTRINEARVKAISHGDPVTARFLHQEFFTFGPVAHIFLFVNHKPRVNDDTTGFWRGVDLLPFLQTFTGASDDKDLGVKLEAEKSGILNWLIAGCLEWQKRGLSPRPKIVTTATTEYKRESNALADWFETCTIDKPDIMTLSSELYKSYTTWADNSNLQKRETLSFITFSKVVKGKYPKVHEKDGNYFVGIGLVTGLVTGFSLNDKNLPLISSCISSCEDKRENPSQPVNPSTSDKNKAPKRLTTVDFCPDCGGNNIAVWPDATGGYFCEDCNPCFYIPETESES
jgi:putative DNA primase/helicase